MLRVLRGLLRREGYVTFEAANGERALQVLEEESIDAILTDLKMPHMNGLELLHAVQRRQLQIPVILLTAHGTIGGAVEALKQGAFDYLTKPFDPDEIQQIVSKAVRTYALQKQEARVGDPRNPEKLLLGESPRLREVKRVIERVARTPATVLITGESGTGKELVARSLHLQSARSDAAFVKINCAAIPEGLLESELFGHEKGAFTGAARRKLGRFELAHGGTLFLDEIGEMPLASQPKLLRVLQDGRFYHVGGTHTIEVDVRLIAATNRDLEREVRKGRFREDLFYRLNVLPIRLPPLRERREDIPVLARSFAARFGIQHRGVACILESDAETVLCGYDWPGNIRELENAIERAVLLAEDTVLRARDLPGEMVPQGKRGTPATQSALLRDRVRTETRRIEREAIEEALRITAGNVTQAARRLGLSRRGLQLKMKELDIERSS